MQIYKFENGPFMVNTFLVVNKNTNEAFILDPGSGLGPLFKKIEADKIKPVAVIATHGHIDHVSGVSKVKKKYNIPFYINEKDKELIEGLQSQARMFGVPVDETPEIDGNLPSSGEIEIAGLKLQLLYTPGHSPGSVSIKIGDVVFSGDTLFNFSIGRTDLPGGDYATLMKSIKEKLFSLKDSTKIFPGHGPDTEVGREKKMNPFFG